MSARDVTIAVVDVDSSPLLEATLRSLDAQDDTEIIVQGGPSFAAALQAGLRIASGQVCAVLRPGELLVPGASAQARAELDGERSVSVVMGRCACLVDGLETVALEHPAEFPPRMEHLKIWSRRFDTVAYSSLFWKRDAIDAKAPFPEGSAEAVLYELSCRLSLTRARKVDRPWSQSPFFTRHLPTQAIDELIAVSRRHWGGWSSRSRWECEASWLRHGWQAHDRARHHARRAETARAHGDRAGFTRESVMTWLWSPRMARGRLRDGPGS